MLECTWKTCCLISTINQGSKVTSEKLSVLFCSAWSLPLNCKILNENIQRYRSDNQLKFQHQNSKKVLVQSSWKTSKFQMFIISEIQVQFQKFQLCWAQKPEIFPLKKFCKFWWGSDAKSPFCWITWHGMTHYLYVKESESEILESLESEILESDSDILSLTLQPWVPGWKLEAEMPLLML